MDLLIEKLSKDVKAAAGTLNKQEARFLVDLYYQMQKFRITTGNQIRILTAEDAEEPHATIRYMNENYQKLESNIKLVLKYWAEKQPICRWMLSICGIGPVIAAGLYAHIDIRKAKSAGAIWKFAGIDGVTEWKKGEKRPWNGFLKTLCWKLGQSFVKVSNNEKDIYGKIYKARKEYETGKNEAGDYAEFAALQLKKKNFGKSTEAYKCYSQGILPPAHINSRAERYAVKMFLSHLFDTWYRLEFKKEPPLPYVIANFDEHIHMIEPPPFIDAA